MSVLFCSGMLVYSVCIFFFVKQKTAYEMRISDWSSDVCSSDLDTQIDRAGSVARAWLLRVSAEMTGLPRSWLKARPRHLRPRRSKIGRASCRERVCQYV